MAQATKISESKVIENIMIIKISELLQESNKEVKTSYIELICRIA